MNPMMMGYSHTHICVYICESGISNRQRDISQYECKSNFNKVSEGRLPVPWRSIFTSPAVWGTIATDMGNTFGLVAIGSYGSLYLKVVQVLRDGSSQVGRIYTTKTTGQQTYRRGHRGFTLPTKCQHQREI